MSSQTVAGAQLGLDHLSGLEIHHQTRLRLLVQEFIGDTDPLLQPNLDLKSILEVTSEFYALERWLAHLDPGIFVCGAARLQKHHHHSQTLNDDWGLTSGVGALLAKNEVSCFTGGGPGGMAAASEGAAEAGGKVVGICIKLKHEEEPNPHMTHQIKLKYFFPRKCGLVRKTAGAIITPGGMGTLDEAFECITFANELANRTGEIYPVAFLGECFKPLEAWLTKDPNGPTRRGYMPELPHYVGFFTDPDEATRFTLSKGESRLQRLRAKAAGLSQDLTDPLDRNEELALAILGGMFDEEQSPDSSVIMDPRMVVRSARDYINVIKQMRVIDRDKTTLVVGGEAPSGVEDAVGEMSARLGYALKTKNRGIIIGAPLGFPAEVASTLGNYFAITTTADLGSIDRMPANLLKLGSSHPVEYGYTQRTASLHGSSGAIVLPGGMRTLDLLCELWNLRMCHKIPDSYQFSMVDTKFWGGFTDFLMTLSTQEGGRREKAGVEFLGYMDESEVKIPLITDDASAAVEHVTRDV